MTEKSNTKDNKKSEQINEWKLPASIQDALLLIKQGFDREFQAKMTAYIKEIKDNYKGYDSMPSDVGSLAIDIMAGKILTKDEFLKQQEKIKGSQ